MSACNILRSNRILQRSSTVISSILPTVPQDWYSKCEQSSLSVLLRVFFPLSSPFHPSCPLPEVQSQIRYSNHSNRSLTYRLFQFGVIISLNICSLHIFIRRPCLNLYTPSLLHPNILSYRFLLTLQLCELFLQLIQLLPSVDQRSIRDQ